MTGEQNENRPSRTRTSFVRGLKAHDEASWKMFYEKYRDLIYGRAIANGLTVVEAEEAVQETFLTIFKMIDAFVYDRTRGRISGLVFRTAGWRIGDQRRQRMPANPERPRPEESHERIDQVADAEPSPSHLLEQKETQQLAKKLYDAVMATIKARISDRQFQIYDLHVEKGWSVERVCRMLAVSKQDVYNAAHRIPHYIQLEIDKLKKASAPGRSSRMTHLLQRRRAGEC